MVTMKKRKIFLLGLLISLSLLLIPTLANARTSCEGYCEGGIHYYKGSYNRRTEECSYSAERCRGECNSRGTDCAAVETTEKTEEDETCDPYCEDGIYYGRGIYNRSKGECEYQYRTECENGCNSRETACSQEGIERDCPEYCSSNVHYYNGEYDEEAKECTYERREVCEYGCDLRQNDCARPGEEEEETEGIEKTCEDTDEGKDFEERGKVTWTYGNREGTIRDHCAGSTIIEYYCDDNMRAVDYKRCSEEDMICKDAECVELEEGGCIDPDGKDVTTKAWAEGTNTWNEGLVKWGDYCSETPEGSQTETGDYIHEAICLETSEDHYEVRYKEGQKCAEKCVDGICIEGKAEEEDEEETETITEDTITCGTNCYCMTREAGSHRFVDPEMCSSKPCGYTSSGTNQYCIKGSTEGFDEEIEGCRDSDGRNIHIRGRIVGFNSDKTEKVTSKDYCSDSKGGDEMISGKWVIEKQCDNEDKIRTHYRKCPEDEWCSGGKCVPRPRRRERFNIKAKKEMESEIDEQGNLIISKGNQTLNLGDVGELIRQHVGEKEQIEEVNIDVEDDKPVYNIRKRRRVKVLGVVPADMEINSRVDAETGKTIREDKPWWAFLT